MCGIYARISRRESEVGKIRPVAHRGPDGHGVLRVTTEGWYLVLAHWRLAVIDPTADSDQPFRRVSDGPVLIYNGEIYNYLELRGKIGGEFRTSGDTEVLLAAYEKWGLEFLSHLRGMFSFVLWDPSRGWVIAARDRFGIKPLYFRKKTDGIEFASEIKQLLPPHPKVNLTRARDFLLFGAQDHTPETFLDGISQISGGQVAIFELKTGTWRCRSWYSPEEGNFSGSFEEAARSVREKFLEAIEIHLRSDVPLGFCLSGGMDSSAIVCTAGMLQRGSGAGLVAYHCHYKDAKCDELIHAEAAATLAGARLRVVEPQTDDLPSLLDKITYYQDEPVENASLVSQFCVFEAAKRDGIKVMLDGQGGDELLASYPEFFAPFLLELMRQGRLQAVFREAKHFERDHGWSWHDTIRSLVTWFTPRPIYRLAKGLSSYTKPCCGLSREFLTLNAPPLPPWQHGQEWKVPATVRALSLLMIRQVSLPKLLHWEDRNSMAHSLESRVPFLDHELVELVLSLPADFKIKNGETKHIIKEALRDIIPPRILARRDKLGFATPESQWLRADPGCFFSRLLDACADEMPGIFKDKSVRELRQEFATTGKNGRKLWRAAMFVLWARKFGVRV